MPTRLLIADDNERVFESLRANFGQFGIHCGYAADRTEIVELLREESFDALLLDVMLGEDNGLEVLAEIQANHPDLPVIVITGYASVESAVEAMKQGAFDYVKKPLDFERLLQLLQNALSLHRLRVENRELRARIEELTPRVTTRNARMQEVLHRAEKLAGTDLPVLIIGEHGCGKEIVADYLHGHSKRSVERMEKINCAAFPESLLDNELFGHEKGAFTGASESFRGIFERAHGGTLLLDEIGDMPLTTQAKILRVLQNHEIRRIGGTETLQVDVRFVAATHQDLPARIAAGEFREDLYYRLNAAVLEVPPLRERSEDVMVLANEFLRECARTHDKPVRSFAAEVLELFLQYPWPGNIRELKNTVNYASALCNGEQLEVSDLPPALQRGAGSDRSATSAERNDLTPLEQAERNLIARTLRKMGNNKKQTAEILGMSRKTLYNRLARYGISP